MTIFFIDDAVRKLRVLRADKDIGSTLDLYRGMKNVKISDTFFLTGGTEVAPMSWSRRCDRFPSVRELQNDECTAQSILCFPEASCSLQMFDSFPVPSVHAA